MCRRNRTPRTKRANCGQGLKYVRDPQSQDSITQEGSGSKPGICLAAPGKSQIPNLKKKASLTHAARIGMRTQPQQECARSRKGSADVSLVYTGAQKFTPVLHAGMAATSRNLSSLPGTNGNKARLKENLGSRKDPLLATAKMTTAEKR